MHVGQTVKYVPALVHAHQYSATTGFPWVFGWKTNRKINGVDEVLELSDSEVQLKLRHIRRANSDREKSRLVTLKPNGFWKATVRALNEEETIADLDIQDPTTGATLHYDGVPINLDKATPHTCH